MISIRPKTFETNSSSCHAMVHLSKDELKMFASNKYDMIIHIPDCEGYREEDIGHEYSLLSSEDAMALYNKKVDLIEENHRKFVEEFPDRVQYSYTPYEKFTDEDVFFDNVENGRLEENDVFGKFMTYGQFMYHLVINSDMDFDIFWWNNC